MAKGNGGTRRNSPTNFTIYENADSSDRALAYEINPTVDYRSVYAYTERGMGINAYLRGDGYQDREDFERNANELDKILSQSTIGKDTTLYRGDNYEAFRRMFGELPDEGNLSSLVGKVGSKKDFTSTYAHKGAEGAQVRFIIQMPGDKKGGLYLTPILRARGDKDANAENEVLLNRGLKFKITKAQKGSTKTRDGRNTYVFHLKVI